MWNIIKEELKYLTKTKWKIVALVLLLFVPAVYAGAFFGAFKTPMKGMNNAKVAVLNLDKTTEGKDFSKRIAKQYDLKTIQDKSTFKMNIKDVSDLYKTADQGRQAVKDKKYDAILIIDKDFGTQLEKFSTGKNQPILPIEFYTSYKNNYLSAELLEMRSTIVSFREEILSAALSAYNINTKPANIILNLLNKTKGKDLFTVNTIGKKINDYGQGMFPYFLSIGLWAGCVMMVFTYKNHRSGEISMKARAIKNYLSRTMIWIVTGWLQTLIMCALIFALGLKVQMPFGLIGYALFVSTMFSIIVQSIAFFFQMGELGSFFVLILLIAQLVAASATFPVEMQSSIFRNIHPLLPFTYTIQSFREFLWNPSFKNVMGNQWPLFIYLILSPISLLWNMFVSRRHLWRHGEYKSHEINFHDE